MEADPESHQVLLEAQAAEFLAEATREAGQQVEILQLFPRDEGDDLRARVFVVLDQDLAESIQSLIEITYPHTTGLRSVDL